MLINTAHKANMALLIDRWELPASGRNAAVAARVAEAMREDAPPPGFTVNLFSDDQSPLSPTAGMS